MPRLPIYLVLDTSAGMAGDAIEQVKQGIRTLHDNLMGDPSALETTYLSVITFDSSARQLMPLTELNLFTPPDLQAGGTTAYGAALKTLLDCVDKEVVKDSPHTGIKGDRKPLVFIISGQSPTDSWESYADEVKQKRLGNVIAIGCGGANPDVLKRTTENVIMIPNWDIASLFDWKSAPIDWGWGPSINMVGLSELPPTPAVVSIVP